MAAPTAAAFVAKARSYVGTPYVFGGASPGGFDCSGLPQWCLTAIGVHGCPRTSEAQYAWCHKITEAELAAGDLIFEQWPGDSSPPGHVVIYAGGGQVVEAPQTGKLVQVRAWSATETTIVGYGRVPGLSGTGGTAAPAASSSSDPDASSAATGIVEFLAETG
jgi:cell wall-associated NlpC family hydrolase